MFQHIQDVTEEVQEKSQDSRMSKYTSLPRKFHHGRWRRKQQMSIKWLNNNDLDNNVGLSIEDRRFLEIMEKRIH